MLIDVHAHFGRLGKREYSEEALKRYAAECQLDRVLVSNISAADADAGGVGTEEPDANLATLRLAQETPAVAPVYWLRPGHLDHSLYALAGALDSEPFAGVFLAPLLNNFTWSAELLTDELRVLEQAQRPVLASCGRRNGAKPSDLHALAARHPGLAFVFCCGTDVHWADYIDCIRRAKDRNDARLYLSTAHATVEEVVNAVRLLGAEHVLFGTDAAVHGAEHGGRIAQLLTDLRDALAGSDYSRITGENAEQLFTA